MALLRPLEIERVERQKASGITSREVVQLFSSKGARLSEATFRKYVQVGLLPRSRRVGRKGKHTGSTGIYPVSVVRRINLIKKMMAEGLTIEEIRGSFVVVRNQIDDVETGVRALLDELFVKANQHPQRREMQGELNTARREVSRVLRRIERAGGRIAAVRRSEGDDFLI